jgi:subtilisin family serine protease
MAMTVTRAELEALAADNDVVRIHEDGQNRPGLQDSVPLIGMPAAYADGGDGQDTMVAILDTGVQYDHIFTVSKVAHATCFSTTTTGFATYCPNGADTQEGNDAGRNCTLGNPGCDHGTHVAGIAAGNRASGIANPQNGVAKRAWIWATQVFSRRTSDNAAVAFDSDMLQALNDLLARLQNNNNGFGFQAPLVSINMSIWDSGAHFTGNCDATMRGAPFKTVIDGLLAQNVATVIISGNGSRANESAFPGCISTAITVGSTTKADAVSNFSNVSAIVDLFAPGSAISSSVPPSPNFSAFDGTSMAAPHVAGAFAAVRSACPSASIGQIEAALESTGLLVSNGTHTRPRINVDDAIEQLCGAPTLVFYTVDLRTRATRGRVFGEGTFVAGSQRTVTARPKRGFRFVNWTENGVVVSNTRSFTFTLTSDRVLRAHFRRRGNGDEVSVAESSDE